MSDDEINWESAFSDDSLDEVADAAADAVDKAPDSSGEQAEEPTAEQPPVDADPVPPIAEMTAPPVIEQPAAAPAPEPAPAPQPAPAPAPEPAQAATPRAAAPTQQMPVTPPPPVDDDDDKGGGIPIKKIVGALAVVIPLAIAAFMFFRDGGDPKAALCDEARERTEGGALGGIVDGQCADENEPAAAPEPTPPTTEASSEVTAASVSTTTPAATTPPTSPVTEPPATSAPTPTTGPPTTTPPNTATPTPQFVYPALINDLAPDGALASGCNPGSDTIPDGVWFVFLTSWSSEAATVDFACALTGSNADVQAQRRGDAVTSAIYATNDNPKTRIGSFSSESQLILTQSVSDAAGLDQSYPTVDFDAVLGVLNASIGQQLPVWIYVNGGEITELVVQEPASIQIGSAVLNTCDASQLPSGIALVVDGIPANDPDKGLNMRLSPVDGAIIDAAPNGTMVPFLGGCQFINTTAWWEVEFQGQIAWASSRYLIDAP